MAEQEAKSKGFIQKLWENPLLVPIVAAVAIVGGFFIKNGKVDVFKQNVPPVEKKVEEKKEPPVADKPDKGKYDEFLKLLTEQMRNQEPTQPMDTSELLRGVQIRDIQRRVDLFRLIPAAVTGEEPYTPEQSEQILKLGKDYDEKYGKGWEGKKDLREQYESEREKILEKKKPSPEVKDATSTEPKKDQGQKR